MQSASSRKAHVSSWSARCPHVERQQHGGVAGEVLDAAQQLDGDVGLHVRHQVEQRQQSVAPRYCRLNNNHKHVVSISSCIDHVHSMTKDWQKQACQALDGCVRVEPVMAVQHFIVRTSQEQAVRLSRKADGRSKEAP